MEKSQFCVNKVQKVDSRYNTEKESCNSTEMGCIPYNNDNRKALVMQNC